MKEDPLACATDASSEESPSPATSPITDLAVTQTEIITGKKDCDGDTRNGSARQDCEIDADPLFRNPQHQSASGDHLFGEQIQPVTTFSDRDESAVRGLLALGSSNHAGDTITDITPGVSELDTNIILSPLTSTYTTGKEGPNSIELPSAGAVRGNTAVRLDPELSLDYSSMPESERLELLRHYRYHVAPWVRPIIEASVKRDI